ncbi:MAG: cytochrome b/b6 domain-containing protein [Thermodesulfobacteriota bacterium]
MSGTAPRERATVPRHDGWTLLEHWAVALSGLLLLFSGFGQMPMYSRYLVDRLPGLGWSSDYDATFQLHLWAAAVFTAAVVFHAVRNLAVGGRAVLPRRGDLGESARILWAMLTRRPEPPSHKFLAEQRLAYAFLGSVSLVLAATGLVKVFKNFGAVDLPHGFVFWTTLFHNVATVFFLLGFFAHLGAFVVKANRPLLPSIFTGRVDREYARHRHPLWTAELEGGARPAPARRLSARDAALVLYGAVAATGVVLGLAVSPSWYALTAAVALAQAVAGLSGRCPLERALGALGYETGNVVPASLP